MYLLQHVRRNRTKSLPNSPTLPIPQYSEDGIKTSSLLSQKIPPLIPEIDLSRRPPPFQSQSQDDSRIGTWSGLTPIDLPLRRAHTLRHTQETCPQPLQIRPGHFANHSEV